VETTLRYDETMGRLAGEPREPDVVMRELAKARSFVVLDHAPLASLGCCIFWVKHETPLTDLPAFIEPLPYSRALLIKWARKQSVIRITLPEHVWNVALDPPKGSLSLTPPLASKITSGSRVLQSQREVVCSWTEAGWLLRVFQRAGSRYARAGQLDELRLASEGCRQLMRAVDNAVHRLIHPDSGHVPPRPP